ncbi:mucin-5AC [Pangasianodon hypophthalmus]|uniref:mucin-5AC n=1 Tax=Pangasianodon hypophthalmus TaxID=310915 RepID=UPI002307701E|nr:mucin-5AC [Pangasianodon hypophthalmus]
MRLLHVCLLFTFITGFNTSEEDPDPSQIPYTDSDRDLASPSRDRSTGVTRLLYIFGLRIAHTLWTASVRQGGGYSGSGDKTRLPFVPQESTHNGQEKAGSVISDLAYTATHSLTDSKLSFTEKEQDSSLSSAETRWPGLSVSTLTTATSANSNTGASTLPEKAPHTTKIYSDAHNDRDAPLVRSDALNALASKIFHSGDITVMSSASTVSRPHLTTLGNEASVTELETSESQRFHDVTDGRDASVMSSSHTANEGRNAVRHSSETFTTNRFPHPNHMNQNNADLSVTDESNFPSDSVSELEVSKFSSVTYISGGAMRSSANTDTSEIEASRTNRLPRSTHINENVSIHTHSSLVDDSNTVTDTPISSVSHRQIDASTLSDSHVDASENTANRKRTEYYSYTPYYTSSPNTDSTPPESATTQASHTIHSEHTAVPEQTTEQQMSDANTQHTSSEILPTQSDWSSVPSTRQDFTSASASYSANTLGQGDPMNATTLPTSFLTSLITTQRNDPTTTLEAPYDTTETKSSTGTEIQTQKDNDNEIITITSESNNPSHVTTLSAESRPTTVTHYTSSTSRNDPATPTTPNPAVTPPSRLTSPSTHTLDAVTTSTPPANLHTSQTGRHITTTRWAETRIPNLLTTSRNTPIVQRHNTTATTATTTTTTTSATTTTASATTTTASATATTTTASATTTTASATTTSTASATTTSTASTAATSTTASATTITTTSTASTAATSTAASTTTTQQAHTNTRSQPGTHTPLTPGTTQTSSRRTFATKTDKDWSHKGRVFITEDQPANISVETFQVLLQVILEENSPPYAGLVEVEPFLQNVAGYQGQHVTWLSGPVLQSVVTFRTAEAVSWLGRAESLLQEAGLRPLPARGVFVSGVRVKNITVGGLHSDVCSWLFSCPSDFYCVSFERNVTCRSVCHSEYCKNHGICVHRSGQHPVCQCPVGEDFWFMGQRCDLRMTQQRLAGVCFGVLAAIAALMGLLAYLAVQRFKKMLIQAKAEQTQSSYRRFNHFDELSARFWRRSWPGSEDSLDNTAFSRSDELLHMRALDRACCYHDDTLSIASTYPDSVTHLNTVYPHSSQYHWDMSMCSLADGVIDSGKASDLSVCSWPIEPIQWTPFPLLQQLRNTNTVKPSRPRSYCEGMELVGLEKSRTA